MLAVLGGVAVGCQSSVDPRCLARCHELGFSDRPELCRNMCGDDCESFAREYGMERACEDLRAPSAAPTGGTSRARSRGRADSEPADPGHRGDDQVSVEQCRQVIRFEIECRRIGLPEEPGVTVDTRRNNELIFEQHMLRTCLEGPRPPRDQVRCFTEAASDCAAYEACLDRAGQGGG